MSSGLWHQINLRENFIDNYILGLLASKMLKKSFKRELVVSYDPVQALLAAGVFQEPIPETLALALKKMNQDEVDMIISAHSETSKNAGVAPWALPAASAMQGEVALRCMCGVWSGSGSGAEQVQR
jgi:hypothetical protein